MLIADAWLMELSVYGPEARGVAGTLLQVQVRTFRSTGHLIDYSQELPRRQITASACRGRIWGGYVRCLRCGCLALLREWLRAVPFTVEEREAAAAQHEEDRLYEVRYLGSCQGEQQIADLVALLADDIQISEG